MSASPGSRARFALVLLLAAVYALCYTAIKAGLPFAPPLRFAALRALGGGAAVLSVVLLGGGPFLPARRHWPWLPAVAAAGTIVAYGAMFLSPGRTGAGLASVLGNTTPLLIIVLAAAVLGERVTPGKAAALALGLLGVTLTAAPAFAAAAGAGLVGNVLPLIAAAGAATESVLVKRIGLGTEILRFTAWQLLLGGTSLLLLSAWLEREAGITWTPTFIGLVLFLGVVGTGFTTTLWYWLLQRDEVGRLSLALFLAPVAGLLLAVALFGERLRPVELLGVAVTVSGIGIVLLASPGGTRGRAPPSRSAPCRSGT